MIDPRPDRLDQLFGVADIPVQAAWACINCGIVLYHGHICTRCVASGEIKPYALTRGWPYVRPSGKFWFQN